MPGTWVLVLAALMASYDLATRRIPNPLNAMAALSGLAWALMAWGLPGLGQAVLGGLIAFALMAVIYFIGGVGAGDVKAMAALGTFLSPWGAFELFVFTLLAGGVLAVLRLAIARRGVAISGGQGVFRLQASGLSLPYGVAICAGAFCVVLSGGVA
jgi:prepilin peptidase CpaA